MKIRYVFILFLTFIFSGVVSSDERQYSKESRALLSELEKNIKGSLLAISEAETLSGNTMTDFYYSLELPDNLTTNLGLVLDVIYSPNSFKVLSVTPGSEAEKLNIKSGDLVLSINGIKISTEFRNAAIDELHQLTPGQSLKLELISSGQLNVLTTLIKGKYVPGIKLEIGRTKANDALKGQIME